MSFALRYTSGDVQVLGLRSDRPQRLMGSAAMACVAFACSWTLAVNLTGPRAGAIDVSGTIFDAIEKVGLKLEARKLTVDTIIVNHVSKTPTAN